ncbi:hypothetical protein ACLOJK_004527 [Asimina triloba]
MEESDIESAETEMEGHDKGKEIHDEDFSKYQPKKNYAEELLSNSEKPGLAYEKRK